MYVDHSSVVLMVFKPVDHQSNKHVNISCHCTRELAEEKVIAPLTNGNLADVFTKSVNMTQYRYLTPNIILHQLTENVMMNEARDDAVAMIKIAW